MKNKYLFYFLTTINVVIYLLAIATWIMLTEFLMLNLSLIVFNLAFTGFIIVVFRKYFSTLYSSRQFLGFSSAFISAILIFCILSLVNYLAFKHPINVDLSKNELNSLTSETIDAIKKMNSGPLKFLIFTRKQEGVLFTSILDNYRYFKKDIEIEVIDGELRPDLVNKYGIEKLGTIVAIYAGKSAYIYENNELAITNALIELQRDKKFSIYYSIGHNEKNAFGKEKSELSELIQIVEKSNYNFSTINLSIIQDIPPEVDLLIIWGPKIAFFDEEIQKLDSYLEKGGKLLLALDPDFNHEYFNNLRTLIRKYGLVIENDLVVDGVSFVDGTNGTVPLLNLKEGEGKHFVTKNLSGMLFFPLSSGVSKNLEITDSREISIDLFTSDYPNSWANTNHKEIAEGKIVYTVGEDRKGPVSLWGAVKKENTRIAVFGTSSFVINSYSKFKNNFSLFMYNISWLLGDDLLSNFDLAVGKNEPVFITEMQKQVTLYFSVIFLPLILFIIAFILYLKKKT